MHDVITGHVDQIIDTNYMQVTVTAAGDHNVNRYPQTMIINVDQVKGVPLFWNRTLNNLIDQFQGNYIMADITGFGPSAIPIATVQRDNSRVSILPQNTAIAPQASASNSGTPGSAPLPGIAQTGNGMRPNGVSMAAGTPAPAAPPAMTKKSLGTLKFLDVLLG